MTKILLVDDDITNIAILEEYLDGEDYVTVTASDGLQALDVFRKEGDVDIILLDKMMPNMGGIEFMEEFNRNGYKIPVIMQTAATSPEDMVEGSKSGVYYYLTKPYTKELLLSILKAAQL